MGAEKVLRLYEHALSRAPTAITGVVAGSLGFVGDAVAQEVEHRRAVGSAFDGQRSFAFTLYAIGWGAFGLRPWLNFLNRRFPGSAPSEICKKVAAQQFVWNPTVYLPSFYAFNGLLRGQDVDALIVKIRQEYVTCLVYIWKVWIPLSFSIFAFVPVRHQVAANFLANLLWNTLLSLFYNSTDSVSE
eukprot:s548_g23.t1